MSNLKYNIKKLTKTICILPIIGPIFLFVIVLAFIHDYFFAAKSLSRFLNFMLLDFLDPIADWIHGR